MKRDTSIILGSGFSKAVANLPVTKEMIDYFKKEMVKQEKLNNNHARRGKEILEFIENLKKQYIYEPYSKVNNNGEVIWTNICENFEKICSFIDLNLNSELHALIKDTTGSSDLSGKPLFANFTTYKLKELRLNIINYLVLVLSNDVANEKILIEFENKILNNCNSIITFNYDLILDKFLYKKQYWFPKDGYGYVFNNHNRIKKEYLLKKSKIKLLKMHGSINWKLNINDDIELKWYNNENEFYFPGYLSDELKRNFNYIGVNSIKTLLIPSYIKNFDYKELIYVWNNAHKSLRKSKIIYFIGYSLPKEDTAVISLLSTINWNNKKIIIIDPNAYEIRERVSFYLRKEDVETHCMGIEEYLKVN